jgi:poly-beta-1,6-N-acetyl-D-glucosamine synthase
MRLLGNRPATPDLPPPVSAPAPRRVSRVERRRRPPGVKRRHGVYVPLKPRIALTFVAGALWFCFSLWLSRGWIRTLGHDISTPLAILVIAGIALIPGYLNIQLISSILLDSPRPLRFDVDFPQVTLLIAAYNEEDSIAETLDYALRADYPAMCALTNPSRLRLPPRRLS